MKKLLLTLLLSFFLLSPLTAHLEDLENKLQRDLQLIQYYPNPWLKEDGTYDVVIIGGGMAGMSAAFALKHQGIQHLIIFDENSEGMEGPWVTFARMKTLQSSKDLMGIAFHIPNLTFRAWFEAQLGFDAWERLGRIPKELWMEYLKWYRKVLKLPVKNNCCLVGITPSKERLELDIECEGKKQVVLTKKLVLATGRKGFGGAYIPTFMQKIAKSHYAHTAEEIDYTKFKDKKVCIVGCGASGFDAAIAALENSAKSVTIYMRRSCLPEGGSFSAHSTPGFTHGFYQLDDAMRMKFMLRLLENGAPPTLDSIKMTHSYSNFHLKENSTIATVEMQGEHVKVNTECFDYLILATGFNIDSCQEPSFCKFHNQILLWGDLYHTHMRLKNFPYLGAHFEFKEKVPGSAPYLKQIYCFNYASLLSHGHVADEIFGMSVGATRLAEGIAKDFFLENSEIFYESE